MNILTSSKLDISKSFLITTELKKISFWNPLNWFIDRSKLAKYSICGKIAQVFDRTRINTLPSSQQQLLRKNVESIAAKFFRMHISPITSEDLRQEADRLAHRPIHKPLPKEKLAAFNERILALRNLADTLERIPILLS